MTNACHLSKMFIISLKSYSVSSIMLWYSSVINGKNCWRTIIIVIWMEYEFNVEKKRATTSAAHTKMFNVTRRWCRHSIAKFWMQCLHISISVFWVMCLESQFRIRIIFSVSPLLHVSCATECTSVWFFGLIFRQSLYRSHSSVYLCSVYVVVIYFFFSLISRCLLTLPLCVVVCSDVVLLLFSNSIQYLISLLLLAHSAVFVCFMLYACSRSFNFMYPYIHIFHAVLLVRKLTLCFMSKFIFRFSLIRILVS